MLRERVSVYRDRVRRELTTAITEDYTPHEIGVSYAIGLFVTAMPTGGLGIGVLFGLAYWKAWASKTAMIAAIVTLNPLVKPAVYVTSYQLGTGLFGTEQLYTLGYPRLDSALALVQFLLLGNVLLGLLLSAVSYAVVVRVATAYRRRRGHDTSQLGPSAGLSLFGRRWR